MSLGSARSGTIPVGVLIAALVAGSEIIGVAQLDSTRLVNPLHKQTLRIDESEWRARPPMTAEARARMEATIAKYRAAKAAMPPADRKVSSLLRTYQKATRATPQGAARGTKARRMFPMLGVDANGAVRVRLRLRDATSATLSQLSALGIRLTRVNPSLLDATATATSEQIDLLAASPAVDRVAPITGAIVHAGSVTSEGVAALKIDRVQQELGVTGKGARVGVISDGMTSIAQSAATGDIPVTRGGKPAVELCPLNDNSGDEGTALLEVVHDVAPDARLAFCPGFGDGGEQGEADAVMWLAKEAFGGKGAQIIVDDVGFLTEPYFQDGVIAQAVDTAVNKGVSYFSSAGNGGDAHYELPYVDTSPGFDAAFPLDVHDFGLAGGLPSDIFWNGIVAGAGNFFAAFLQWTDPFGGATNDYDVYIFDINGRPAGDPDGEFPIGGNGIDVQDGTGDPLEVAFIVNPDGDPPFGVIKPFFVVVDRFSGNPHKLLELNFNGLFAMDPLYNVPDGSVWGHAASRGALAIGATGAVENFDGTPNPNLDIIEEFSARGPSRIFFTPNGRPRIEARRKPDLVAVDGVSVTGVNFVNPFFGTSASAPHAAGIAALLKDIDDRLNPAGVERVLRETAVDRGTSGFDATWGNGLVDALAAARRAAQVGNSQFYYLCLSERPPVQIVAPATAIAALLKLGADFGKCGS